MNIKRNYYKILGIDPSADETQIKTAYKKLVKRWHPDLNNNSFESRQMMKDINEAYEILSDDKLRIEYNKAAFGSAFVIQGGSTASSYQCPPKDVRDRVQKRYDNKYQDARTYYEEFEKKINEGRQSPCRGSLFDKFQLLYADASYLPYTVRFFMLPVLVIFAVLWHGSELTGTVFTAFVNLFSAQDSQR